MFSIDCSMTFALQHVRRFGRRTSGLRGGTLKRVANRRRHGSSNAHRVGPDASDKTLRPRTGLPYETPSPFLVQFA